MQFYEAIQRNSDRPLSQQPWLWEVFFSFISTGIEKNLSLKSYESDLLAKHYWATGRKTFMRE